MSKATPAVTRFAAVLRLLAADPARPWSLSEIAAELAISLSTCHATLTSLHQADLIYRGPDKRYVLGSLAAEIGRAAASHYSPAELLQSEMSHLAHETGCIAFANYRNPHAIHTRKWFTPGRGDSLVSRPGYPLPLHSLWGAIFYAFEPRAAQEQWLDSQEAIAADAALRDHALRGLERIASRRYGLGLLRGRNDADRLAPTWEARSMLVDHFPAEPQDGAAYSVAYIAAPVFDPTGQVAFAISITGHWAPLSAGEISALAGRLAGSARKLSHFLSVNPAA